MVTMLTSLHCRHLTALLTALLHSLHLCPLVSRADWHCWCWARRGAFLHHPCRHQQQSAAARAVIWPAGGAGEVSPNQFVGGGEGSVEGGSDQDTDQESGNIDTRTGRSTHGAARVISARTGTSCCDSEGSLGGGILGNDVM